MKISKAPIPDILILEPSVWGDERGYFMETWRKSWFDELGVSQQFVQDNQSKSGKGTLRGLHYQLKFPQGKLARVVSGEVFDVAVDLRRSSPTFGKWFGLVLTGENKKQLWIPPGFAHGFYVLSETAELLYKCTDYYHPEDDYSLRWDDSAIGIEWPQLVGVKSGDKSGLPLLSDKDRNAKLLHEAPTYS